MPNRRIRLRRTLLCGGLEFGYEFVQHWLVDCDPRDLHARQDFLCGHLDVIENALHMVTFQVLTQTWVQRHCDPRAVSKLFSHIGEQVAVFVQNHAEVAGHVRETVTACVGCE